MDAVREEIYKGHTVKIFVDKYPVDPWQEWDHFGEMCLHHKRYSFPDDVGINTDEFSSWGAVYDHLAEMDYRVILPIYMYDHSGLVLRVGQGFSEFDPQGWDWGQLGFICASAEEIRKEYGVKRITNEVIEKVKTLLIAEAETYGAYLSGDVFGYGIEDDEDYEFDGCWGFYGDWNDAFEDAKSVIDWHLEHYYHQLPLFEEAMT